VIEDPGLRAGAVLFGAALAGFVALGIGWAGLASKLLVPLQLPFLVSGAIGGVALTGASLGLLAIHLERRATAVERAALDGVVRDAAELAELVRARAASSR
jgi:hypothetical protein